MVIRSSPVKFYVVPERVLPPPVYLTKNGPVSIVGILIGEMSERSKEAVLKTVEARVSGGSNPSLSANFNFPIRCSDLPIGSSLERCESGRIGLPAKELYWERYRGFESPPLRFFGFLQV